MECRTLTPAVSGAQIRFEQGTVQTPELLQDIEIPDAVTVLGSSIDLTALKAALQPVSSSLRDVMAQVTHLSSVCQL